MRKFVAEAEDMTKSHPEFSSLRSTNLKNQITKLYPNNEILSCRNFWRLFRGSAEDIFKAIPGSIPRRTTRRATTGPPGSIPIGLLEGFPKKIRN